MTNANYEIKHKMLLDLENSMYKLHEQIQDDLEIKYEIYSDMLIYSEMIGTFENNPTEYQFDGCMQEGLHILSDITNFAL